MPIGEVNRYSAYAVAYQSVQRIVVGRDGNGAVCIDNGSTTRVIKGRIERGLKSWLRMGIGLVQEA